MASNHWIYDTPPLSDVEAKLRALLIDLGNDNKLLGIQGITAGMLHKLVDAGKLKLDDRVADVWPEFGSYGKDSIKHASGKKFQELLEEEFVRPLQLDGEFYIGIPSGVEARLATLAPYEHDLKKLSEIGSLVNMPSNLKPDNIQQAASVVPALFNMLNIRRSIIPAANAHCSARALARYHASLVDCGAIPPPHSSAPSTPLLGSHPHIPSSPAQNSSIPPKDMLFSNPKVHDAFLGVGEYASLVKPDGTFGLGFKWCHHSKDRSLIGFGHSGMGGSTGFCDIQNRFAVSVTLNKMSFGAETARIIQLVCSELNISLPEEYSGFGDGNEKVLVN